MSYQLYLPEVWAGFECTINRVGNTFRDQLQYAKHYSRPDDIDTIAKLGIKKLRYPVLWEAHQKVSETEEINWDQTRRQLEKIRFHQITPIVGLLHHGSGPPFASLSSDQFAEKFAVYASRVAAEFPWVEYYTPINEPLTTARFSGLYGLWFPHHKDALSFSKIFLNELKGIVLSMQAIRQINKDAKLVQTEDLAKVHSTPSLHYQADFENQRRWLTYDILCGRLTPEHYFWNYFISVGITSSALQFFMDNPCAPDIAGFNYYVTSERFLDQRTELHPGCEPGGNGHDLYVDIAAARMVKPDGLEHLLQEAWERFKIPMALTEVHINCTREEQLRWCKEAWDVCCHMKARGIDIKAFTAWSLLGAFDWNSLLTAEEKVYETGVYDITNHTLRPTAVAKLVRSLAETGDYDHPVLGEQGWWNKSYPGSVNCLSGTAAPILILGSNGTLGTAFVRLCRRRSICFRAVPHSEVDITQKEQIERIIDECRPWAIINAAGYVRVDDAESEPEICYNLNTKAPGYLATISNNYGLQLVVFSSDLVFDGEKQMPYTEFDSLKPLNVYGESKARGESLVVNNYGDALIIRTSAFFGPWDRYNFPSSVLHSLKNNNVCSGVADITVSPTYVPHLVDKVLDLLIDEEKGIWHLANDGMLTWNDFAEEIAIRGGYKKKDIRPCLQADMQWNALRPAYSALKSSRGVTLPSLEEAITQYFQEKMN